MKIKVSTAAAVQFIDAVAEADLLSTLRAAGLDVPGAACGGKGSCGKCRVMADGKEVLACRTSCHGIHNVYIPKQQEIHALTRGAGDIAGGGSGLGLAVDIGTTTVAAFLYDMEAGRLLARTSSRNAQRSYGADVISRIQAWSEGHGDALTTCIRQQLSALTDELCAKTGCKRGDITVMSIAANTVMEHIADGLSPVGIGAAPFSPLSLFGDVRPAASLMDGCFPGAMCWFAPALAGYVGGDITAGLYAAGGAEAEGLWLYIDIGTNGEMALGNKDGWLSCATAAGPAFEGAEIRCGMDGSPGAIDKVTVEDGRLSCRVIGGGKARGLCGSGLVDAVACLLRTGELSEAGRLENSPRPLRDDVSICADDIRQLQLAKAAIRAGAETLLKRSGKTAADVTRLVIAGGFGSYMDTRSAMDIGLLPAVPPDRIEYVGNAAGAGAALALTKEGRAGIGALARKCKYFELSGSPLFRDLYVDCMAFETDE
ncbi:MAG: DUF4445 domain-containing protein [Ruminococcaceae bacterium]|nr:DUF4445 domain-containing protein [Oscillospiraceae bacterium]